MIALIDGDIVVYQSAAKAEKVIDWGDDDIIITGSKRETRDAIDEMVSDLKEATGADRVVLAFSDHEHDYFRCEVYPKYKTNRAGARKPVTYKYGREYAESTYEFMVRDGLEADDILGILSTTTVKGYQGDKVVCSLDKDMLTFPGRVYNWSKPQDGIVEVTEPEADFNFFMQILTGDSVDGYPGCPGLGPVRAGRLLDPFVVSAGTLDKRGAWEAIAKAYEKKGLTEEDALAQARCARILRAEDYDFKNHKPLLWQPPKGE